MDVIVVQVPTTVYAVLQDPGMLPVFWKVGLRHKLIRGGSNTGFQLPNKFKSSNKKILHNIGKTFL